MTTEQVHPEGPVDGRKQGRISRNLSAEKRGREHDAQHVDPVHTFPPHCPYAALHTRFDVVTGPTEDVTISELGIGVPMTTEDVTACDVVVVGTTMVELATGRH